MFGDSLESRGRLGWPTGSDIAGYGYNYIDAKRLQLRAVDRGKRVESGLRCARWTVEGKR